MPIRNRASTQIRTLPQLDASTTRRSYASGTEGPEHELHQTAIREPTVEQADDLVAGVRKTIKTLF
jgi:hypothetical protein